MRALHKGLTISRLDIEGSDLRPESVRLKVGLWTFVQHNALILSSHGLKRGKSTDFEIGGDEFTVNGIVLSSPYL